MTHPLGRISHPISNQEGAQNENGGVGKISSRYFSIGVSLASYTYCLFCQETTQLENRPEGVDYLITRLIRYGRAEVRTQRPSKSKPYCYNS